MCRPHLDASAARVDGERRLVLPHLRSCGSSPRREQLDAAVGREHRVVRLVEADHVVGRCELRVAPPDLRGIDGLVHYTGTRHRLAERGEMRRVGRPEVEPPHSTSSGSPASSPSVRQSAKEARARAM